MDYKPTIGLEIHIELNTASKMFCSCRNDSGETEPNKNICPICLAHPGVLPMANEEAIKKVVKTALALNCQINKHSFFERKNYFYPDLPKGYQISQYQAPLSKNGYLDLPQNKKKIRITRIHLEEDTGSLVHPEGTDYSLVNFNRSGVPLMELVTEPDLETSSEVKEFIKELQLILRYLDVSGANMEKGEMRCEINISLAPEKTKELGTKVEVKNLNSIAVAGAAVEYEIKRQSEILEKGENIVQETRGWHDAKRITFSQRQKEQAHDYLYFPEPDLPALNLSGEFIESIKNSLPELPQAKRFRFQEEYGLNINDVEVFIGKKGLADFFEQSVSELGEWVGSEKGEELKDEEIKKLAKIASNYLINDVLGQENEKAGLKFIPTPNEVIVWGFSPENFAEFVKMIYLGEISSKIAKTVLVKMIQTGNDPSHIVREEGLVQISDTGEIENIAKEVIALNPKPAADYKKGKMAALQFLIGQLMGKTKGKASPELAKETLEKMLK
ncbi:MAG: Asp-tRNA(Asn)/Glu-tRNA(Gln) amidotransferase subunit GatB [Candidatus Pacebacteria bacterium]|nr:Asp-tRNA(Asn)/Glu-tRNA(Gln) amidotransferase subunit GatB [Candidatus Paceibacterota bacterium]